MGAAKNLPSGPARNHRTKENKMRFRIHTFFLLLTMLAVPAFAQHVELGGFASYENFDVSPFPNAAVGIGGRFDFKVIRYLALEGELSYDLKHPSVQIISATTGVSVTQFRLGILHGNAGLRLQTKSGSYFLFVKGGALDFFPQVNTTTFIGGVLVNLPQSANGFTKGVFYPGGGIGFHAGPLGIRLDAGDEIYWNDGAKNNLRITFGPFIRF
jgi:hypothetical protein